MTIVDLDAFRKKKKDQEAELQALEDKLVDSLEDPASRKYGASSMKIGEASDLDLFTREAMRFRFQNMKPPGVFATIHTEKLPPPFPPYDDLPPLVA